MTARGWCPSLHEPMATGDGLLVRVKPPGGVLTGAAARLLAAEAERHGNGVLELTSRASLQVRGLSDESVGRFARAMVAAGLASADRAAERRRSVIATPLAGVDPAADAATAAITAELERALEAEHFELPAKFGFLVDGGGVLPASGAADVRVRLFAGHAEIGCGGEEVAIVGKQAVVAAALLLARAAGGRRMRDCVAAEMFAAAGLRTQRGSKARESGTAIGAIGGVAFGAGLRFGSTTAAVWAGLADLAERHGDGTLRLTASRAVLLAGARDSEALRGALAALGLITDPDDPLLRVAACPGRPACAAATVVTRDFGALLRPPVGCTIHVSGCEKGCAHPGPAWLTLVGQGGRFEVVRDGRAAEVLAR